MANHTNPARAGFLTSIQAPTAPHRYPTKEKRCAHTQNLLDEVTESTTRDLNER